MLNSNDETIIEYLSARDERALELAAAGYGAYIRRIAANILGDERDAEECVNDVMLRLWNADPEDYAQGLSPVVATAARCVAINRYNALRRQKRVPSQLTQALESLNSEPRGGTDTEDAFFASELSKLINGWLRTLGETDRYIFISRFFESEPVSRIAEETGINPEAIYKRLKKLKIKLKNVLERNGYTI